MPDSGSFATTERTRVRRHPERAGYDRDTVYAILDAALLCHVGYVIDGLPYVTPTLFWRDGERLYWHGSSASRMLRAQRQGIPVCLTVSHVDGLVLGRCAFRHSLNYRAVMALRNDSGAAMDARKPSARICSFLRSGPSHQFSFPSSSASNAVAVSNASTRPKLLSNAM